MLVFTAQAAEEIEDRCKDIKTCAKETGVSSADLVPEQTGKSCALCILDLLCSGYTSILRGEVKARFFRARRIASRLTGISISTFALSSRSLSVHLLWPSGTGPQAISMIFASAHPSNLASGIVRIDLSFQDKQLPQSICAKRFYSYC